MNIFERFSRVAKANVNELLNKMEDPEKVMNQAVEDLQKDLVKIRQSYAEVMATQKRMEKQRAAAEQLANEWLNRAQLALQNEDEELAREALSRKGVAQDQAATLAGQLETQATSLNQLFDSMQQLEAKIVEAKAMKEQYVARARTAATSTKVNDMLAGVGENSMGAFDRMKEKVESLETQAEVSSAMLGAADDVSLDQKFKALEGGASVDDELAAMKAGMALPGSSATETKTLPGDSAVEDELAKLRKEMEE
jgi:phage shock protein A